MRWRVTKPKEDGTCRVIGIDLGPVAPIWWQSIPSRSIELIKAGSIIVLKISGSTQWAGRGEMKYYGAYFQVLKVEYVDGDEFVCESLIEFPVRKK